jgi:hypothetical protein
MAGWNCHRPWWIWPEVELVAQLRGAAHQVVDFELTT